MQVAGWNDRPSIVLPPNDTLSVIAATQLRVGRDIINVTDTDDVPGSLELTVQYQVHQSVVDTKLRSRCCVPMNSTRYCRRLTYSGYRHLVNVFEI